MAAHMDITLAARRRTASDGARLDAVGSLIPEVSQAAVVLKLARAELRQRGMPLEEQSTPPHTGRYVELTRVA